MISRWCHGFTREDFWGLGGQVVTDFELRWTKGQNTALKGVFVVVKLEVEESVGVTPKIHLGFKGGKVDASVKGHNTNVAVNPANAATRINVPNAKVSCMGGIKATGGSTGRGLRSASRGRGPGEGCSYLNDFLTVSNVMVIVTVRSAYG